MSQKKDHSVGSIYFTNSKNKEITELQNELDSMKPEQQKEAMKQIIASMTIGKDVSSLFPNVVKCMRTTNVELKKLIYLYIINYAKAKPDLTFLAVAGFHSDAMDKTSPLIRALAVRTMGCIRVNMIVQYLCETLTHALKDNDPYVRKTACMCVAKLYNTSPELVRENGFLETLTGMLTDGNAIVVANSLAALAEISTLSGENQIKLRSKTLKRVLAALSEANEWSQVYILDALAMFTPKKAKQAEDIIENVTARMSHANPAVVMSAIKVVLKFLDWIENIENVRNYSKKVSNSITTVMMEHPEIQYVLLRSLHAIVIKRPYLLDKDFKYFYIQYTDPIYVKLEKIDILYRLTDSKNFESIINELKSYAIMEYDVELVKRVIRYIGYIAFKFELSMEIAVEAMKEILEHNLDFTLSEGIIVARDIMRKYKGKSLELLKKIDEELIKQIQDPDAKEAVLFIIGEFCTYIKNSTELITPFVESISSETPGVRLQILSCVIKNYVNKPDETETLVQSCLLKCGEESENPDVRDRAYIYWRLLETEPDIAKEMLTMEKPSFEFKEDNYLEGPLLDNIIENMTNMSSVCHKTGNELIPKEDMIGVEEAEKEDKEEKETTEKEKQSKGKEKEKTQQQNMDADLLGLDEETSSPTIPNVNPNAKATDIFNILDMFGSSGGGNTGGNTNPTIDYDAFGFTNNENDINEKSIKIFDDNSGITPATPYQSLKNENGLTVYSSFHRENGKIYLGLYIINKHNTDVREVSIALNTNSFGLSLNKSVSTNIPTKGSDKVTFEVDIDASRHDKKPPTCPYKIDARLTTNIEQLIFQVPVNLNALLVESGKMTNSDFVSYLKANTSNTFNQTFNVNNSLFTNDDSLNKRLEKNNIFHIAKNARTDPPTLYYTCKEVNGIPCLIECSFNKGTVSGLKVRVISAMEPIVPLVREVIEKVLDK
jgi:vesicle coat complex subunit